MIPSINSVIEKVVPDEPVASSKAALSQSSDENSKLRFSGVDPKELLFSSSVKTWLLVVLSSSGITVIVVQRSSELEVPKLISHILVGSLLAALTVMVLEVAGALFGISK